jgi:23S rRNA (cytidine2498-2'-O)-methyltransferase
LSTDGLLAYCRPGFEPELAAELSERSALAGFPGYAKAERNTGFVQFLGIEDGAALASALPWSTLIFARQKLRLLADLPDLDPKDRVGPIMEALGGRGRHGDVWVEHTDSDEGRQLSGLARALGNALRPALRKRGLVTEKEDPRLPRLHVLMLAGNHALLASADPKDASPWPLGVPRLRAHADAPSRSSLKLEEAPTWAPRPAAGAGCWRAGTSAWPRSTTARWPTAPWTPASSNTSAPTVSAGSRPSRWTGWSATWSSRP